MLPLCSRKVSHFAIGYRLWEVITLRARAGVQRRSGNPGSPFPQLGVERVDDQPLSLSGFEAQSVSWRGSNESVIKLTENTSISAAFFRRGQPRLCRKVKRATVGHHGRLDAAEILLRALREQAGPKTGGDRGFLVTEASQPLDRLRKGVGMAGESAQQSAPSVQHLLLSDGRKDVS